MDTLNGILLDKNFEVPAEVAAIKTFVRRHFQSEVEVKMGPNAIIVTAPSASLIGALRLHINELQVTASTNKRLILRIGTKSA